mmetsp:Transcript_24665/g.93252  ORF Transcript_24665/g.93252 Transcript_24665/m.93252 type:complete len:272 (-) Transcript_24665:250-1065(-)
MVVRASVSRGLPSPEEHATSMANTWCGPKVTSSTTCSSSLASRAMITLEPSMTNCLSSCESTPWHRFTPKCLATRAHASVTAVLVPPGFTRRSASSAHTYAAVATSALVATAPDSADDAAAAAAGSASSFGSSAATAATAASRAVVASAAAATTSPPAASIAAAAGSTAKSLSAPSSVTTPVCAVTAMKPSMCAPMSTLTMSPAARVAESAGSIGELWHTTLLMEMHVGKAMPFWALAFFRVLAHCRVISLSPSVQVSSTSAPGTQRLSTA